MRTHLALLLAVAAPAVALAQPQKAPAAGATGTIQGTVTVTENGKPVSDASVVVYVVGPPNASPAKQTQQVRQKNRAFVPDLIGITVGDDVVFPNDDSGFHNVFSPKPKFDLGTLKKGENKDKPQTFKDPGVVDVYCNIHPEMAATILVLPNRFHTLATNGKFTLAGVPKGTWNLFAYTRRATKPVSMKVTIDDTGKATADLTLVRGPEPAHTNKFGTKYTGGKVYP